MIVIAAIHITLLLMTAVFVWRRQPSLLQKYFWPALILKCTAGIALGLIYTYYYPEGDTFHYFTDGKLLAGWAKQDFPAYIRFLWNESGAHDIEMKLNFTQPRALFLSKIVSVFCLFTANNYWIISLYFSLVSFLAAFGLIKYFHSHIPESTVPALISFLFFPSVVFWSSGIIKESLSFASLLFLVTLFLRFYRDNRLRLLDGLLAIPAIWLLWNLKYYFAGVFLAIIVTCIAHKYIVRFVSEKYKILTWGLTLIIPLILVSFLHPNFHFERIAEVIVSNYQTFQAVSDSSDVIHFYDLSPSIGSMVMNAPWALASGLFRPFLFETDNMLQFLVAIENTVLLILFLFSLRNLKNIVHTKNWILILALTVYVAWLCIFITLSTPNFGTLSRYRIGYLPFFIFLILHHNPAAGFLQRLFARLAR